MAHSKRRWISASYLFGTILFGLLLAAASVDHSKASNSRSLPGLAAGESNAETLISNDLFLYASTVLAFDTQAFLETQAGPLAGYDEEIDGEPWTAADSIQYNAMLYGINPQLLLTLLEAQTQVLTDASARVPMRAASPAKATFYSYMSQMAKEALLAYDQYRYGISSAHIIFTEGETIAVPETMNAGTYALQAALASTMSRQQWERWAQGTNPRFVEQFSQWFGDPQQEPDRALSASTSAPSGYILPFPIGETWYYTGGPHNYGGGTPGCISGLSCPRPWSAVDIAQPELIACPGGSYPAHRWIVAAKSGNVIQSSQALIVIDHGDGWRTYYSHVSSADRRGTGPIDRGDRLGHPSCEVEPGGFTTGVHVHFALYQGGVGFVDINGKSLSGWLVGETSHYNGTMILNSTLRQASTGRYNGTNDIVNKGVNGSCPISGGVLLYKHANYDCNGEGEGSGYVLRPSAGFQDLPAPFNDEASSIRVPPGWSVRLFEHSGRGGASVCRNGDDLTFSGDFFDGNTIPLNDRVSSFEVFDGDDCPDPSNGGTWALTFFGDTELNNTCAATTSFDGTYVFRDWGSDNPAGSCPADNWGARFTGHVYFPSGTYDFGLSADDWARLKVDGETVIDNWQGAGQLYGSRVLTAGSHEVIVEYADLAGESYLSAWWWGPGYETPRENQKPGQWYGRYWGNRKLGGNPVIFLNEGQGALNHEWGTQGPGYGLPVDRFSGRFERQVSLLCGSFRVQIHTDDGVRFWIDDQYLLDAWYDQVGDYEILVDLESGSHALKLEHYENGGGAAISLSLSRESICPHLEAAYLPFVR